MSFKLVCCATILLSLCITQSTCWSGLFRSEIGWTCSESKIWHCGSSSFSKSIANRAVTKNCPAKKGRFNWCCWTHDRCYENQHGRQYCDKQFYDCLSQAAPEDKKCSWIANKFYQVVHMHGLKAYQKAGEKATKNFEILDEANSFK
uniref:Phospholipase A2 domain-containing protein n=1 Tax=Plectus sambesii TaxID=2011161 RepID=A0A914VD88_9BILA